MRAHAAEHARVGEPQPRHLGELTRLNTDQLGARRAEKFLRMGKFEEA